MIIETHGIGGVGKGKQTVQEVEKLIVQALQRNTQGLTDGALEIELARAGVVDEQLRMDAMNALLTQSRMQLLQRTDG